VAGGTAFPAVHTKKSISTGKPGGRKNASSVTHGLRLASRRSAPTPVSGVFGMWAFFSTKKTIVYGIVTMKTIPYTKSFVNYFLPITACYLLLKFGKLVWKTLKCINTSYSNPCATAFSDFSRSFIRHEICFMFAEFCATLCKHALLGYIDKNENLRETVTGYGNSYRKNKNTMDCQ